MLSNTAIPKYYGLFREKVMRGEIPVCNEISLEMNRIDALIADPDIYYDDKAIDGFIKFCESELTLTDGSDLHLLDTFKLWAEQIFGWWFYAERQVFEPATEFKKAGYVTKVVKKRLTTKQYLIVARGGAKSMYAAALQAYFLTVDSDTTHQITSAPTMKQAEEVMSPIRTAIARARGPLFKFLTLGSLQNTTGSRFDRTHLASTKKGIESFLTNSLLEIRPMSINKLQGLRPKVSTVDEWLSGDLREDVIGSIEQGASKMPDYLIVAISSEGTVRNGSGDTIKMELADILRGEYYAPHISIWHYKLDSVEEVGQPEMWPKAQPNLGFTVEYDVYHLDVERSEKAPAARNDILAKRFGLPMEGYTWFFAYEETIPIERRLDFRGLPVSMGVDLSRGDDFCAFTFLVPLRDGAYGIKTRSYITEMTLHQLPGALRHKYDEFINEGSLVVMPSTILDVSGDVFDDLTDYIERNEYDVNALGFDPYNAKEFVLRWEQEQGVYNIEKVIQGARTESVPLGEIKKMAEAGLLLFDEFLMGWCMGNAITIEDTNGNRKLLKRRHEEKIDNVSALVDAWVAFKLHKEDFE